MPHDWDRLVRWGLAIGGAATLSIGSGLALAHFTVQGTSQFYMPQASASETAGTDTSDSGTVDSLPSEAATHDAALWQLLPNAGKITRAKGESLAQTDGFDSSPN